MRDINRIEPFLKEVAEIWKKSPDLRFGQLIENIRYSYGGDLWWYEEEEFLKKLKEWMG